jgi:hypothetical protein
MTKLLSLFSILLVLAFTIRTEAARPYDAAASSAGPEYRQQAIAVDGTGGPRDIENWTVTYRASEDRVRVVKIQDGHVEESFLRPGHANDAARAFDPARASVSVDSALHTARQYANDHQIQYDTVRAHLARPEEGRAPVWRIELLREGSSRGFVYTNGIDGALARYERNSAHHHHGDNSFDDDVESTFKGVGADMEEFFTGHRSVDR